MFQAVVLITAHPRLLDGTTMEQIEIVIRAGPAVNAKVRQLLTRLTGPTQAARHCVECRVSHDEEDPELWIYSERWTSRDALHAHIRSEEFKQILVAIDMSSCEPIIRLDEVVSSDGIQAIAAIRNGDGLIGNSAREVNERN